MFPIDKYFMSLKPEQFSGGLATVQMTPTHEVIFRKNFELLKVKYSKKNSPVFDVQLFQSFYNSFMPMEFLQDVYKSEDPLSVDTLEPSKILLYLGLLTMYEINVGKAHFSFNSNYWEFFAQNYLFSSKEVALKINQEIFKTNQKYYGWTNEEDDYLRTIMLKQNPHQNKKNCWKTITQIFNQGKLVFISKKPNQVKERWENFLKKKYKKGSWSNHEDLTILSFVQKNGTKWARLSRLLTDRTEHDVKNRFFGLLSIYISTPIKEIKKHIAYLDAEFLAGANNFFQKTYAEEKKNKTTCGQENSADFSTNAQVNDEWMSWFF